MSGPGRVESRGKTTRKLPTGTAEEVAYKPSRRPEKTVRSPYPTRPAGIDYREPASEEEVEGAVGEGTVEDPDERVIVEIVPKRKMAKKTDGHSEIAALLQMMIDREAEEKEYRRGREVAEAEARRQKELEDLEQRKEADRTRQLELVEMFQ